ncbi:transglutaminase family protein [Undibacterium squillarum]|uniref:Transglutaminase n=1 Tax=Undibacterium squillarum TaxID=1131567 RepID=A0ABQ2XY33_9BURK|nr:transglutaminase family protein [Undibacterium squillarum]GGX40592.1 transglutaminase [Undibacterium squillarum]
MDLYIEHLTRYRYSQAFSYSIQQLRLTPRQEQFQQVRQWSVQSQGRQNAFRDAYQNPSHLLTMTGWHDDISITARGTVSTSAPPQGRVSDGTGLSPLIFINDTRLTSADDAIRALAASCKPPQHFRTEHALQLAKAIEAAVSYQPGSTEVSSTAAEVLQQGQGVCQDHTHVYLACCHALEIPARYVSGYLDPETGETAQTHAWVDVWVEDHDYAGWVSLDVTHTRLMNASYCRLAIGRDYDSASPVRGVRRGGGSEQLEVQVSVAHFDGQ